VSGHALFGTVIGPCGVAWSDAGIRGLCLPEASASHTRERLGRHWPATQAASPPAAVQRAILDICALLRGESRDLLDVVLDMREIAPFNRRVYEIARHIPPGRTLTYGDIAERLGDASLARPVGHALGRNPFPIVVPCHRVLAAGGKAGGFSAPGGLRTKLRLLSIERARLGAEPDLFDA
jgi:methylated-DNA-[protein]-cysteine S-methyltransferase